MADNNTKTTPILAKASGTSNPVPGSIVQVKGKPSITITYRFFAAHHTARLASDIKSTPSKDSKTLSGMPLIIGIVKGNTLEPFEDVIRRAPSGGLKRGKLVDGAFILLTPDELKQNGEAKAKLANKKLSVEEHAAAQKMFDVTSGAFIVKDTEAEKEQGDAVLVHEIPFPKRIEPGTMVGICINVDAKKKFRQYPVWQVTAGDNDIVVDVFETYGHNALNDSAKKAITRDEGSKEQPHLVDYYTAQLSGAVWMRSTHPFTEADVDALQADVATDAVKTALKNIYKAEFIKVGADFAIDIPRLADAKDTTSTRLYWIRSENSNCISNINSLKLEQDVPKRIHPAAYAAAAKAAHEAGVTEIQFTNSWRPMLGAMPHRTGLGLDIKWLAAGKEKHMLNRVGLTDKKLADKDKDGNIDDPKGHGNISVEEHQAYNDWKASQAEAEHLEKISNIAKANEVVKSKNLATATKTGNGAKIADAQLEFKKAQEENNAAADMFKKADEKGKTDKITWQDQVKKHEPGMVGKYRRHLMHEKIVTQVLDPWYMTRHAHAENDSVPNEQNDGLSIQHNNHLHISIFDAELQ